MKPVTAAFIAVCLLSSLPAFASDELKASADRVTVVAEVVQPVIVATVAPEVRAGFDQRRLLTTLSVGMAGLQAFDTYSTLTALGRGGSESNSLMQDIVGHPAAFIGLKAGITGLSFYASEKLWREHHRGAAIALMAVANGVMAAVAVNNASVLRTSR